MKTTVNIFRTLLLAVLTLTFGACGEDSLLAELGLDGQTSTKVDGAGEVWDGTVADSFAGGSGTAEDPYQIANGAQLKRFAAIVNGTLTDGTQQNTAACGKLTADILLNDISDWENWNESTEGLNTWTPIGSNRHQFTGTLDGDGHSVSGIYINSGDYQGLVGFLGSGGTLQNVGVKTSYIKGGYSVGGLCGRNNGTVTNCYNTGSVAGTGDYAGGLCGYNKSGTVTNCYNTGSVSGNRFVGGLCGDNSGNVTNCYNTGSVTGNYAYVGGLCGTNSSPVTNCYNTGSVTGTERVGGVCGYNYGDTVTNCYNTGSVTGSNDVGGVCGMNDQGTVTNCYYQKDMAAGGINGSDAAGHAEAKTAEQFKSGEVASLLGDGWGQTIGTGDYPVLDADGTKRVYAITIYNGTSIAETSYHNSSYSISLTGNAIAIVDAGSPFSGNNVIVKDGNNSYTCAELVLTDDADFYTPVKFTAANATYTRMPKVWANGESGWETLCSACPSAARSMRTMLPSSPSTSPATKEPTGCAA